MLILVVFEISKRPTQPLDSLYGYTAWPNGLAYWKGKIKVNITITTTIMYVPYVGVYTSAQS